VCRGAAQPTRSAETLTAAVIAAVVAAAV